MEQYENDGTQEPTVEPTETPETLEANETDNGTPDSDGSDSSDAKRDWRAEYFKLKQEREEGSQESGESREENRQQVVASDDALLGRLEARGVMDADDQDFVLKTAKVLGVSPIDALNDDVVKSRLEANQKVRETGAATPQSSSRSGQTSAKETVDYWLGKPDTELPPKENKELRRKVMHARNEKATRRQMFNH